MSRPVAWIGGDPGTTGALALVCPLAVELADPLGVRVIDMSTKLKGERVLNMWGIARELAVWSNRYDIKGATVERVGAMPGQGVTSMFTFGFATGALHQALTSAGIQLTLVQPAVWKVVYRLKGGRENKGQSRDKASQLFPAYAGLWPLVKHDGRAEAVLLADYGSKLRNA